jgi:hypothetical protein
LRCPQIVLRGGIVEDPFSDALAAAPHSIGAYEWHKVTPVPAVVGDLLQRTNGADELAGVTVTVAFQSLIQEPQEPIGADELTLDGSGRTLPRRLVISRAHRHLQRA